MNESTHPVPLNCERVALGVYFAPYARNKIPSESIKAHRVSTTCAAILERSGFIVFNVAKPKAQEPFRNFKQPALWILDASTPSAAHEALKQYAQARFNARVDITGGTITVPDEPTRRVLLGKNTHLTDLNRIAFGMRGNKQPLRKFKVVIGNASR